jgi:glycosyltransferase involved in cell wall biosynthesis
VKILLLHQYFLGKNESGGSRWNEITRVWAEQGHEITVLAGMVHYTTGTKSEEYKGKFFYEETLEDGVEVVRSHVSEAYNLNFLGRLWAYFSFAFSATLAGFFKTKGKYDIIVATSPSLFIGIPALILSYFKRTPFLFEIRDLWPESAIDTGVLKNKWIIKFAYWFEGYVYQKAAKINVLTPAFRQNLIERKGINPAKICFIPNASDFSLSEELLASFDAKQFRQELGLTDKFVIVYVGAHGIANHLIQVVETAELLKDTNVHFLMIGDGMERKGLIEEVKKRKLINIDFIASVPKKEVFKYILASDMGTSVLKKVETFKTIYSNKTFDYMSCKKPILMAIDGISRELLEEAQAGSYVEQENPEDFAAKIKLYINDLDRVKQEGDNGYWFAKKNFDRGVLAQQYIDILTEIVKKGKGV